MEPIHPPIPVANLVVNNRGHLLFRLSLYQALPNPDDNLGPHRSAHHCTRQYLALSSSVKSLG